MTRLRSATVLGVAAISAAIVATPFVTAPGYSVVRHSISELGAQDAPYAWIMNAGFAAFGLGVLVDAVGRWRRAWPVGLAFTGFGLSLFAVAAFSHRPIDPAAPYSVRSDEIHSVFAAAMGLFFCLGVLLQFLRERALLRRAACLVALLAAVGLPLGMLAFPDIEGLLQRAMFLTSFIWLAAFLPD